MVETAWEEEREREREGDDSYLLIGPIGFYTASPARRGGRKGEGDTKTRGGN